MGFQPPFCSILRELKLFKVRPKVPTNPPNPPHPPEASIWSLGFSATLYSISTVPFCGFGLGLDRFLMYLTGMKNIKDVIPYPVYYTSCNF